MSGALDFIAFSKSNYSQVEFEYDSNCNVAWITLNPLGRPCFNMELLSELEHAQQSLKNEAINPSHLVLTSANTDVFSFGGDLELFTNLIRIKDRAGLTKYMKLCIDVLMSTSHEYQLEKIALVRGAAFGGGFEAALSCSHIIAEKTAKFGFPERLFNLFPGMGAYSYLRQRVSPAIAKRIISAEQRVYTADEMHDLGIVDEVIEVGDGNDAVMKYVENSRRFENGYSAIREVTDYYHKIDHGELHAIGEIWVKAAMKLTSRDLRKMEILAKGQEKYARSL